MAEFNTPKSLKKLDSKFSTPVLKATASPIQIPASPLLEKIGYGSGIAVYKFERSPRVGSIRSPWAIKKRLKGISPASKMMNKKCLLSEANLLRQLNHPNIISFRAFTTGADGKPCLAMEAMEKSLGDLIEDRCELEDGPFPAKNIMQVGFELAKALKYLHYTAHILHGDIKSWNVLVSHDFNVIKLADFGDALPLTESLELDNSKTQYWYSGTACWNPPEIVSEEGPVTSAADIWTYGLVLWEMISLMPPHADDIYENESMDESITDASMLEDSNMDEDIAYLEDILPKINKKYGTRPPLPDVDLDKEYERVLEIFFICTIADRTLRPSAKALMNYFTKCMNVEKEQS